MDHLDATVTSNTVSGATENLFPFACLPDLVRLKILREYIPFSDKVNVLYKMPEFDNDLNTVSCWPRGAHKTFFKLLPTLQNLIPGLYVQRTETLSNHGFHLWIDDGKEGDKKTKEKRISFVSCMIMPPVTRFRKLYFEEEEKPIVFSTPSRRVRSISLVKDFFNYFLENYILAECKPHFAAYAGKRYVFLFNRETENILSDRGMIYRDNYVKGYYYIRQKQGGGNLVVKITPGEDEVEASHFKKLKVLKPKSLESLVFNHKQQTVYHSKKVCECIFKISETITSVFKIHDLDAFKYYKRIRNINYIYDWFE